MSEHNLNDYKKAKVIVKETSEVLAVLKTTHKQLSKYKRYLPIRTVLNELLHAESMLSMLQTKHKEVINTKGKVNDA